MTDLFAAADRIVVGIEGNHGNQVGDPGGDTWYGIARAAHPDETPWPPTWERAQEIRRAGYWLAHHCDQLAWPWALAVYDASVNQPGHGLRALQQELGLAADGVIGSVTVAAIGRASLEHLKRWMARRIYAYTGQPLWQTDWLGWSSRALEIYHAAMSPPPAVLPQPPLIPPAS